MLHLIHDQDDPFGRVMAQLSQRGPTKRAGRGFLVCCPAHGDSNPSLKVDRGDDGRVLFDCKAGCSFKDIVSALGMGERELFADSAEPPPVTETRPKPSATLAELAAHKKLPEAFLASLGWRNGRNGVEIPYRSRGGELEVTRIRRGLVIKDGVFWAPSGRPLVAYEPDGGVLARQERYLVVVEGETDTATLLFSGFPALGCPGADTPERTIDAHHIEGVERVFFVREPDRGGEQFAKLVPKRLAALGFTGPVHELAMPDSAKDPSALWQRDQVAFPAKLCAALEAAKKRVSGPVEWRSTVEIFEPLPPIPWRVRGLQLCAGRPSMLAGYGASAKTLSAQALALAVASGTPAWGFFETTVGQVRHLDFEQGWRATARRYQRLSHGHNIDPRRIADRLRVAVFPQVFLDAKDATDVYAKLCDGVDLVVLDALRGATPTQDENDSRIRPCLDNLSRVSEKTGTTFIVLHHAGKPKEGHADVRTVLRGSSAIFDACGTVYVLAQGKTKNDPRLVTQAKPPAEAEGAPVEDFTLVVEDVPGPGNPAAGVRVMHAAVERTDHVSEKSALYDARTAQVLEMVRRNPGSPKSAIIARVGISKSVGLNILDELVYRGDARVTPGKHGAECVFPGSYRNHNEPSEPDG